MGDDPMFDGMQEAPAAPRQSAPADWWFWRRRHTRIFIARTGEDGSQDEWMRLLAEVGAHRLTKAYHQVCRTSQPDARISMGRILDALGCPADDPKAEAAKVPRSTLIYRWKEEAWGRICDLCINPATFLKCRYDTTDPARIEKATKLANEIISWFPQAKSKLTLADCVVADPERMTMLVDRRLIPPPP